MNAMVARTAGFTAVNSAKALINMVTQSECYAVAQADGFIIDKSASLSRANSRRWEIENEDPAFAGQKLLVGEAKWADTHLHQKSKNMSVIIATGNMTVKELEKAYGDSSEAFEKAVELLTFWRQILGQRLCPFKVGDVLVRPRGGPYPNQRVFQYTVKEVTGYTEGQPPEHPVTWAMKLDGHSRSQHPSIVGEELVENMGWFQPESCVNFPFRLKEKAA